jgi:nucleoside-diphosphate-sugar epimerase
MNKAIVTGATGFIGSYFVEYLVAQGIDVLALGRKELQEVPEAKRSKLKHASYLKLDMSEISTLETTLNQIAWDVGQNCIFFNLAWGGEQILSDLNVAAQMRNVAQSVSALEAAKSLGCARFIHVGTMEEAFTEEYLKLDHRKHSQYNRHVIYSVAKMAAKNALRMRAMQLDMEFIYVLHSHVMGPNDDKDSFLQVTLQKLISGDELIFSTGEQLFDVISLEDCALGYYLICKSGRPGETYWVGSGSPLQLREYVERMYQLYPSGREMQFGKFQYNDIVLKKEAFSITNLINDTGYQPSMTFEQTVQILHKHLTSGC